MINKQNMNLEKINKQREELKIQLEPTQLHSIVKTLGRGCNFLVFGLGNDTPFWLEVNRKGKTVFIEDNKYWAEKIKKMCPEVNYFLVKYGTKRFQSRELLGKSEKLSMKLNDEIKNTKWDVILVDAPRGYEDSHPGRMKSIYQASVLVKKSGHVFVHDCDREVEDIYTEKYLKKGNLVEEIPSLRHYIIK